MAVRNISTRGEIQVPISEAAIFGGSHFRRQPFLEAAIFGGMLANFYCPQKWLLAQRRTFVLGV